jgi:short-subunit dehydrogenase
MHTRSLAMVTGASSGIGYELARCCAEHGFDLIVAADDPRIHEVARALGRERVGGRALQVDGVQADLATAEGVDALYERARGRHVDVLLANAGHGLGHAFLDQDLAEAQHVIDTNVSGTIRLIHRVGRDMRTRGRGRILITGSIAGLIPGSFSAVYNGTKAFVDSFSHALRDELRDTGVTVTCLMPGATDTGFFRRADMMDTRVGRAEKDDAAEVARAGFDAMMSGEADVVSGWKSTLQAAVASVIPAPVLAAQHRKQAEPGSGTEP